MRTSLNWAILGYLWISMLRRLLFVALWALARSNPRLHAWMRQAPLFREAIACTAFMALTKTASYEG